MIEDLTGVGLTWGTGSLDPFTIHAMNNDWAPMYSEPYVEPLRSDFNVEPPIA